MEDSIAKGRRPCDNCRRRKIRCLFPSEDSTNCVLCISRATQCTYVQDPPRKKRMLSSSGQDGGRLKQRRKPSNDTNPVLRDYSNLSGQSLLKETLGHQNRQSSSFIGATTDFDPTMTKFLPFNTKGECSTFRPPKLLRRANQDTNFMMRPDADDEMNSELANLDAIEKIVAPYGPELVELYFRIVHPSFPILHKKVFLEKHGRNYRESTPAGLGAVYVLALNWWSYSPSLASLPKPNIANLEKLVLKVLFEVHTRPKISDLQGGLVLMQRPGVNSWAMTGHLVAISQNLGLHLDCSDWQVPDWERGVRKRVAWAMFMQDKWGALVYGRPTHIRRDDWNVQPLVSSDFPETAKDDDDEEGSAEVEKGKQTFLHMVSLTEIVADMLDGFFTLTAITRPLNVSETLEKAKPIQMRLKSWYSNLPASLSVEETTARRLSSVGYLHLAYYTAECTLHRAILRVCSSARIDSDIRLITRAAAATRFTSALDFAKRLKPEHLQSFWYFSSTINLAIIGTFAGTLAATSLDEEDRDAHMSRLAEYRWTLRISSNGADFMKYAVGVLDASSQLLEQQFQKSSPPSQIQPKGNQGMNEDETSFDEFSPSVDESLLSPDVDWNQVLDTETYSVDLDNLASYNINGLFSFG